MNAQWSGPKYWQTAGATKTKCQTTKNSTVGIDKKLDGNVIVAIVILSLAATVTYLAGHGKSKGSNGRAHAKRYCLLIFDMKQHTAGLVEGHTLGGSGEPAGLWADEIQPIPSSIQWVCSAGSYNPVEGLSADVRTKTTADSADSTSGFAAGSRSWRNCSYRA